MSEFNKVKVTRRVQAATVNCQLVNLSTKTACGGQGGDERGENGDHNLHDALQGFLGCVCHGFEVLRF